jgi:hypothetical protein
MSKKRKLVYNGHHGIEGEEGRCLWCGAPTSDHRYVVNPGGTPVLKCCCEEHYRLTEEFIERDSKYRNVFYIFIGIFAFLSWFAMWFDLEPAWSPIPLVGLALTVLVCPRVLPRYEYYLPRGLVRTRRIVRVIAAALLAFSLYLVGARYGVLPG